MRSDYPDDDEGVADPLETRHFFELMQSYRWTRGTGADEFEAVKAFLRENMKETPCS